ncbi:MAG: hypothetical protein ACK4M3_07735, partial [Pyrobaculum sp.]
PLSISLQYQRLGELGGLPIFAAGTFTASAHLGNLPAGVAIVGELDGLGLVRYVVTATYMGVSNTTVFLGYAVPADSYLNAIAVNKTLSPDARRYFSYLVEKAVAAGSWEPVDQVVELYRHWTPVSALGRWLADRSLAAGDTSGIWIAHVAQRVEPLVYLTAFILIIARRLAS